MSRKPSKNKSTPARRKLRSRTTPKWIEARQDIDEIARRRCLMVLSVLSGERPVTEVIAEARIARGTYYALEERALCAMLGALGPSVNEGTGSGSGSPAKRIADLEARVARLEREKRRAERLLLLTRKVIKPGLMKKGTGRLPRTRRASTTSGHSPSHASKTEATTKGHASPSTPTPGGEGEP